MELRTHHAGRPPAACATGEDQDLEEGWTEGLLTVDFCQPRALVTLWFEL
jgi:hypothetical protein